MPAEATRVPLPPMRIFTSLLVVSSLFAVPAIAGDAPKPKAAEAAPTTATVGKAAPDFALKDLDGKEVKLSSFKGKTVVLE